MKPRSRKNVSQFMADVRHPQSEEPKKDSKKKSRERRDWKKIWISIGTGVVFVSVLGYLAFDIGSSARNIVDNFRGLVESFRSFGSGLDYEDSLGDIEDELDKLDRRARILAAVPKLKEIPSIISGLSEVVETVQGLASDLNSIGGDGLRLALAGQGQGMLDLLNSMSTKLSRLDTLSRELVLKAKEFGVSNHELDFLSDTLIGVKEDLDTITGYLSVQEPRRLVLLFENHSELRPSGGFAGSYGELVLEKGGVKELTVNDIYYPDHFLDQKVIPPVQLQTLTPDWEARDTGWFFDFRQSSQKLIEYLEASSIYSKDDTEFDGVIALNVRVVEDILRLTGPIEVEEYDLTLDYKNFLSTIQEEVEEENTPGENPKRVLQFAAPKLLEAMGSLEGENRNRLLEILVTRTKNKDIKFYFEDAAMAALVSEVGIDGVPYEMEEGFVGDYLALVNTNVAGGKTDVVIGQKAILRSEIGADGVIKNELLITRDHRGDIESAPWYNHRSQNFFKIFTPPSSELTYIKGGETKNIVPIGNFALGYREDPDLAKVEDTRTILQTPVDGYAESYLESGKRVFATWFNVDSGDRRSLEFEYTAGKIPLVGGQKYTFVLDKQSGSEMDFEYVLAAPPGFYFEQSRGDVFRLREDKIPSRIEVEITLRKK